MSGPGPYVEETELSPPRKRRATPDQTDTIQLPGLHASIVDVICAAVKLAPLLGDATPQAARLKKAVAAYQRASDAIGAPTTKEGSPE